MPKWRGTNREGQTDRQTHTHTHTHRMAFALACTASVCVQAANVSLTTPTWEMRIHTERPLYCREERERERGREREKERHTVRQSSVVYFCLFSSLDVGRLKFTERTSAYVSISMPLWVCGCVCGSVSLSLSLSLCTWMPREPPGRGLPQDPTH